MRKRLLKVALCALVTMTAAFCLFGCGQAKIVKIGTGDTGGNYYAYGNALANVLQKDIDGQVSVESTAGSAANLRLMSEGFVQLAIVQSDTLLDAANGTGAFEGKKVTGFRAVSGLYLESVQLVATDASGITSVADLKGKRVSIGATDSGVVADATAILKANGLDVKDIQAANLSFTDSAVAMEKGELDAAFILAGAPVSSVTDLANKTAVHLVSLDERTIAQMKNQYGYFTTVTIPAGTYKGQTTDVTTLGVKAVLIASNKLSDDVVNKVTASLFANNAALDHAVSAEAALTMDVATADIPVGFHPGAASYFASQGVTVEIGADGKTTYVIGSQD